MHSQMIEVVVVDERRFGVEDRLPRLYHPLALAWMCQCLDSRAGCLLGRELCLGCRSPRRPFIYFIMLASNGSLGP